MRNYHIAPLEKQPVLVLVTLVPLPAPDVLTNNKPGRSQDEGSGLGAAGPSRAGPGSPSLLTFASCPPGVWQGKGPGGSSCTFRSCQTPSFLFSLLFFFLSPPLNLLTVCFFPAWRRRGFRVVSRHDDGRCSSHPLTGRGGSALKIPKKNLNPPKNPVNAAAAAQRSAGPRSFKAGPQQSSAGGASSGGDVNTARGGGAAIRIWLGFKRERGSSGAAGCAGLPASPALRR